jgi:hypothetical protein
MVFEFTLEKAAFAYFLDPVPGYGEKSDVGGSPNGVCSKSLPS